MENQRESQSWADLPPDILTLFLRKLHSGDQIRFRRVCKDWRLSRDRMVNSLDLLPLVCSLSWPKIGADGLDREIFDPYSEQTFQKYVSFRQPEDAPQPRVQSNPFRDQSSSHRIAVFASKQGWFVAGFELVFHSPIFMYDPFGDEVILLPRLEYFHGVATFSGDPDSRNCQVVMSCYDRVRKSFHIASYHLDERSSEWSVSNFPDEIKQECFGMQFIDGEIFCLFQHGILRKYSLADGSLTLLGRGWKGCADEMWLVENKGDLLMIRKEATVRRFVWRVYGWDSSSMEWIRRTAGLNGSAFYISGRVAMRSSVEDENGEKKKECRVIFFYYDIHLSMFRCVSCVENSEVCEVPSEYGWMEGEFPRIFIEPSSYIRR